VVPNTGVLFATYWLSWIRISSVRTVSQTRTSLWPNIAKRLLLASIFFQSATCHVSSTILYNFLNLWLLFGKQPWISCEMGYVGSSWPTSIIKFGISFLNLKIKIRMQICFANVSHMTPYWHNAVGHIFRCSPHNDLPPARYDSRNVGPIESPRACRSRHDLGFHVCGPFLLLYHTSVQNLARHCGVTPGDSWGSPDWSCNAIVACSRGIMLLWMGGSFFLLSDIIHNWNFDESRISFCTCSPLLCVHWTLVCLVSFSCYIPILFLSYACTQACSFF